MPELAAPRIEGIIGQTGCGKSTLANERLELPEFRRVLILEQTDVKSEYHGARRVADVAELMAIFRKLGRQRYTIGFRLSITITPAEFAKVCGIVKHLGNVKLLIEEFGRFYGTGIRYPVYTLDQLTGKRKIVWLPLPQEFCDLCERGRHSGPDASSPVGLLWLSQRALRCPTILRAETKRLAVFRQTLEGDRAYVAEFPGADRETAEHAKDLQPHNYIEFTEDGRHEFKTTRKP